MKRKILLLLPLYGQMPVTSVQCLLNLITDLDEYYTFHYITQLNLYIPLARSQLAQQAVAAHEMTKYDCILWLDQDHKYESTDVINLIESFCESKYDIMSGLYYYKDGSDRPVVFNIKEDETVEVREDIELNKIQEVDGAGLGFCCMKPDFLKEIHNAYDGWAFMDGVTNNVYNGEDVAFFKKVKKKKGKVALNTNIKIGHVGAVV